MGMFHRRPYRCRNCRRRFYAPETPSGDDVLDERADQEAG